MGWPPVSHETEWPERPGFPPARDRAAPLARQKPARAPLTMPAGGIRLTRFRGEETAKGMCMSAASAGEGAVMENKAGAEPPANPVRRVLGASLTGTAVEFYDFYIYATAAALVFGPLFFPSENP